MALKVNGLGDEIMVLEGLDDFRITSPPGRSDYEPVMRRLVPSRARVRGGGGLGPDGLPQAAPVRVRCNGLGFLGEETIINRTFTTSTVFNTTPTQPTFPGGGGGPVIDPGTTVAKLNQPVEIISAGSWHIAKPRGVTKIKITDEQLRASSIDGDPSKGALPGEAGRIWRMIADAVAQVGRLSREENGGATIKSADGARWTIPLATINNPIGGKMILPNGKFGPRMTSGNFVAPWQQVLTPDQQLNMPAWASTIRSYGDLVVGGPFPDYQIRPRRMYRGLRVDDDKNWNLFFLNGSRKHPVFRYRDPVTNDHMGVVVRRGVNYFEFEFVKVDPAGFFAQLWSAIKELVSRVVEFLGNLIRALIENILCTQTKAIMRHLADVADRKTDLSASAQQDLQKAGVTPDQIGMLIGAKGVATAAVVSVAAQRLSDTFCPQKPGDKPGEKKGSGFIIVLAIGGAAALALALKGF